MYRAASRKLRLLVRHGKDAGDVALAAELLRHLEVVERFAGIDIWSDARIKAGDATRQEIERAIDTADVALLLLSADFLASDVLQELEVPRLLQHHRAGKLRIIPVLMRSCTWEFHPWLAELQPLPRDHEPIAARQGDARDRALAEVVREAAALGLNLAASTAAQRHVPVDARPLHDNRRKTAQRHVAVDVLPFHDHRQKTALLYRNVSWSAHPIPLSVKESATGWTMDARRALALWSQRGQPQHCVLLGDFGTGKTGLMVWLASELAARAETGLVLLVPASRLSTSSITRASLAAAAEPPLDVPITEADLEERDFYLLLDGLDELVGTLQGGPQTAIRILSKALSVVPRATRVIASCRSPVYALIQSEIREKLSSVERNRSPLFAGDIAIQKALGGDDSTIVTYSLLPVKEENARTFLGREASQAAQGAGVLTTAAIRPFLTRPFTIRLLQAALTRMQSDGRLDLDQLFEKAVTAQILRESPSLSAKDLESVMMEMEAFALGERKAGSAIWTELIQKTALALSSTASLGSRHHPFDHYSYWEFFYARRLLRQIVSFNARLLAGLNLVGGYNINRMLVPMLVRRMPSTTKGRAAAVTTEKYREFLRATGWRRDFGYGIHPSMTHSHDGTPSTTFDIGRAKAGAVHHDTEHDTATASGISWYDAAAFSLWAGAALPTSKQARELVGGGSGIFWCSDWYNEELAHISGLDARTGELHGINPDVRLPRMKLAVIQG